MLDNAPVRRIITVTGVLLSFSLSTVLLLPLLALGLAIDSYRLVTGRHRAMTVRILLFGWIYLLGEVWALIGLAVTALLASRRSIEATYRLQESWAYWNFRALRRIFSLGLSVEGEQALTPGPIIILSRHASIIDTLLPSVIVSRGNGIRLRYVLKRELLVDPALDIAGNRLPNHFVARGAGESDRDRSAIRRLAIGLGPGEGILIYPEGTRFTEDKRDRYVAGLIGRAGPIAGIAAGFRSVLPPRPGGTLALLEGSSADVVVLSHRGLEGFATVRDIWSGDVVGTCVQVRFERIERASIPVDRSSRVEWLFRVWQAIDDWAADFAPPTEP